MIKFGNNDTKLYLGANEVTSIYLGSTQVYSGDTPTPPTPVPYDEQYLTIESTSNNNTIYWLNLKQDGRSKLISVSTDNGTTWTEYSSSDERPGTAIATLNTNDKLLLKGMEEAYEGEGAINSSSSFIVYGNIMSLLYEDMFVGRTTLSSPNTFSQLFSMCAVTSAENLILPATTLVSECYYGMFRDCTSLTTAPQLSATTLADSCCRQMFQGCSSLTTAPELPATTLADNCYYGMFNGCTGLTTAPELPATTLTSGCYRNMFFSCTSLNYIKCLATDNSAFRCTYNWVANVAASGTFVKAASMNDWETGIIGIPSGWTVEDEIGLDDL